MNRHGLALQRAFHVLPPQLLKASSGTLRRQLAVCPHSWSLLQTSLPGLLLQAQLHFPEELTINNRSIIGYGSVKTRLYFKIDLKSIWHHITVFM